MTTLVFDQSPVSAPCSPSVTRYSPPTYRHHVQGRATVKNCPPGTQFCTVGNICDFPTKVTTGKQFGSFPWQISCDQMMLPHNMSTTTTTTLADQPVRFPNRRPGPKPQTGKPGSKGRHDVVDTPFHIPNFAELDQAEDVVTTRHAIPNFLQLQIARQPLHLDLMYSYKLLGPQASCPRLRADRRSDFGEERRHQKDTCRYSRMTGSIR